jgi:hypothetical protein
LPVFNAHDVLYLGDSILLSELIFTEEKMNKIANIKKQYSTKIKKHLKNNPSAKILPLENI